MSQAGDQVSGGELSAAPKRTPSLKGPLIALAASLPLTLLVQRLHPGEEQAAQSASWAALDYLAQLVFFSPAIASAWLVCVLALRKFQAGRRLLPGLVLLAIGAVLVVASVQLMLMNADVFWEAFIMVIIYILPLCSVPSFNTTLTSLAIRILFHYYNKTIE